MAIVTPRTSLFSKAAYLSVAVSALALFSTSGHAGFEWIPAPREPVQKPTMMKKEMPPAVNPPAVQDAPAMEEKTADLPPLLPLEPEVQESKPEVVELKPVPKQSKPVMQVKNFQTPKALKEEDKKPMSPMPEKAMEEKVAEPEPVVIKRRVIVPDNAPETALKSVQDKDEDISIEAAEGIQIEAQPLKDQPEKMAMPIVEEDQPVSEETVEGFGTDMPLALALSQIVPATYSYSFAESVNPGYRVSWNGGKSWIEVVQDMIEPLSLVADVRGRTVHIRNEEQSAVVVEPTPEEPAEKKIVEAEVKNADAEAVEDSEPLELVVSVDRGDNKDLLDKRVKIQDPGEDSGVQPVQTLKTIEKVAADKPLVWEAEKGDSLKQTLVRWSGDSDVKLVWEASHDYPLQSDLFVTGSFKHALKSAISSATQDNNAPLVTFTGASDNQETAQLTIKDQPAG